MSSSDEEDSRAEINVASTLRRQVLPDDSTSSALSADFGIFASRQIPPVVTSTSASGPSALNRTRRLGGYETPPLAASGSNRVPVLSRRPISRSRKATDDETMASAGESNYTVPFEVPPYIANVNQMGDRFFTTPPAVKNGEPSSSSSRSTPAAASSSSTAGNRLKYWLPTCWDTHDKSSLLDLSSDHLTASFGGSAKYGDRDAAAVRSNRSIPPQSAVYYFEVSIIDKGQAGYIGIGVSGPNVSLSRLPGWEKESWALHGDDGSIFSGRGQGTPFGPTYGTGDVIGVGVDWTHSHSLHATPAHHSHAVESARHGPLAKIFFTKNGQLLGPSHSSYAFENVACTALYPTVGLRTPGEKVKANFGAFPFVFDIEAYVRQRRLATTLEFKSLPTVQDSVLHNLILSYLKHHGYAQTANAFAKTAKMPVQDSSAIERRGRIRKAILEGRMQDARTDLEAVTDSASTVTALPGFPVPLLRMREWVEIYWQRLESAASAPTTTTTTTSKGKGKAANSESLDIRQESDQDMLDYQDDPADAALLDLGAELNEAYAATHAAELEKTFSLLAYADLESMPPDVRSLLSQQARDALADQVNEFLLQSEGSPTVPDLEVVWRYAEAQRQWASEMGTRAALVSIQDALAP